MNVSTSLLSIAPHPSPFTSLFGQITLVGVIEVALTLLLSLLAADLLTGIFHWWEDNYGKPEWPIVGKLVIQPNREHHDRPRELANSGYWDLTWTSWVGAGVLLWLPWVTTGFGPTIYVLTMLIAAQANQVHAWAHRTSRETPNLVRVLQRVGLMQSRREHGLHHSPPFTKNYCILTNYLNPVLHRLRFWQMLERLVFVLTSRY